MGKKRHSYRRDPDLPVVEIRIKACPTTQDVLNYRAEVTKIRKRKEKERRLWG